MWVSPQACHYSRLSVVNVATGHIPVPDQYNSRKGEPQNRSRVAPEVQNSQVSQFQGYVHIFDSPNMLFVYDSGVKAAHVFPIQFPVIYP